MSFAVQYLRYPDLFPARAAGEPCGREALAIDLPGGAYVFSGLSGEQRSGVESRFGPLCRDPRAGDADPEGGGGTRLFRAPAEDFLPIDTRGWEYALDLEPAPAALQLAGMNLMGRLDWPEDSSAALPRGALWTCEERAGHFAPVLENFLRAAYAYRLAALDGALVHSAGVVFEGRAFLLVGPSGAGKSTAARLCQERGGAVLSDDLNALRRDGDAIEVERLPFTGDLGTTEVGGGGAVGRWPLAAVLRLAQGEEDSLRPLSHGCALATLLAASPFVNRDPYRREPLLELLAGVALRAPAYTLTFRLGADLRSILAPLGR